MENIGRTVHIHIGAAAHRVGVFRVFLDDKVFREFFRINIRLDLVPVLIIRIQRRFKIVYLVLDNRDACLCVALVFLQDKMCAALAGREHDALVFFILIMRVVQLDESRVVIVQVDAPGCDVDFFADQVAAEEFAVDPQIDASAGRRPFHAQRFREAVGDLVSQKACVGVVGQKHPLLRLVHAEHFRLAVKFDLIRSLGIFPGRVAPSLDFHAGCRQIAVGAGEHDRITRILCIFAAAVDRTQIRSVKRDVHARKIRLLDCDLDFLAAVGGNRKVRDI